MKPATIIGIGLKPSPVNNNHQRIFITTNNFDENRHRLILRVSGKFHDELTNFFFKDLIIIADKDSQNILNPLFWEPETSIYAQLFDYKEDKIIATFRQDFAKSFLVWQKEEALQKVSENYFNLYWHSNRKVTKVQGPYNQQGNLVTSVKEGGQYQFFATPNQKLNKVETLSVKWGYRYDDGDLVLFKNHSEKITADGRNMMTCSFHKDPERIKVYAFFVKESEDVMVEFTNDYEEPSESASNTEETESSENNSAEEKTKPILIWSNKVSAEFCNKVLEICKNLWGEQRKTDMANGLMAVMYVETWGSFKAHHREGYKSANDDPKKLQIKDFWKDGKRDSTRAVGLIQFTQDALEKNLKEYVSNKSLSIEKRFDELNKLKLKYAQMGEIKQLDKVQKYFEALKDKMKSPEDIYLSVFAPKGVGKKNNFVLYEDGTDEYTANKSVDTKDGNNDGKIQRSEILSRYYKSYEDGKKNQAKPSNTTSTPKENSPAQDNSQSSEDALSRNNYADVIPNPTINDQGGNRNKNRFKKAYRTKLDGTKYQHTGVDILTNGKAVDLHSLMDGEVVEVVNSFKPQEYKKDSLGNNIIIKSVDKEGKEVWINYCHLNSVSLKKGESVKHGQKIGVSGCTGNAGLKPNGSRGIEIKYWHCHIEASRENKFYGSKKRIDPEQFMKTKFDAEGNPIRKN